MNSASIEYQAIDEDKVEKTERKGETGAAYRRTLQFPGLAESARFLPQSPVGLTPLPSTMRMAVRSGALVRCTTPFGMV